MSRALVAHSTPPTRRAAISVRIRAHAAMTCRRKCCEFVTELAAFIEQFTRAVAFHPRFQLAQMLGILEIGEGDLMRAKCPRPARRPRILVQSNPSVCGTRSWAKAAALRCPARNGLLFGSRKSSPRLYLASRPGFDAPARGRRLPRNAAHSRSRGSGRSVPRGTCWMAPSFPAASIA